MKFYDMGEKPLQFDVIVRGKIVIPKGTKHVKIAFRQSHLTRFNEETQMTERLNVYLYRGKVYHA